MSSSVDEQICGQGLCVKHGPASQYSYAAEAHPARNGLPAASGQIVPKLRLRRRAPALDHRADKRRTMNAPLPRRSNQKKHMPRFAANLSMMFTEWAFLDRFAAAADAGFDAVEFLFPYDHAPEAIAERLAANGLEQALFNLPPGNWEQGERGIAALPERRAEFERSVDQALRYAEATGAKLLHLMAGNAPAQDPTHAEAYQAAVVLAAERAAKRGVTIVLEPINRRDMPDYFLNDFGRASALIRRLSLPNLKLQFDIYHRQILHGDIIRGLEAAMDIVAHVQIASVPGRNEPGTGELDDERIFGTLDRLGYGGFVGCEYRPAGGTLDGLAWFAPYRRAPQAQR